MNVLATRVRTPTLEIDLSAVATNTRRFGHGLADVARTALANGATWLGVTSIAEGVAVWRGRGGPNPHAGGTGPAGPSPRGSPSWRRP